MTEVSEGKQYKFSEIIEMLEDKKLPSDAKVSAGDSDYYVGNATFSGFGLKEIQDTCYVKAEICAEDINSKWTVKLPEPKSKFKEIDIHEAIDIWKDGRKVYFEGKEEDNLAGKYTDFEDIWCEDIDDFIGATFYTKVN